MRALTNRLAATHRGVALLGAALLATVVIGFAGCGEKDFSAEDFVAEANENGATLELGGDLVTDDESKDLYELQLRPLNGQAAAGAGSHAHPGGSLAVYDDGSGAEKGVTECEAAADLLCYRAGNVVIVLEGEAIAPEQVALAAAIQKMAE